MTAPPMIDRAQLSAFVDGELSPEESAAVVMHLADHPADQAYVDDLFAANAALAKAFAAPMAEPVPDKIRDTIRGTIMGATPTITPPSAQIIPFRPRPALVAGGLALAASIAAAIVLFQPAPPSALALGPVTQGSALARALETLPSGTVLSESADRDLMILATLPTDTGPCREVEAVDRAASQIELALACRTTNSGWQVEVVLKEPLAAATGEDGFLAADGAEVQGLTPFLDQRGAGLALSPQQEAALIEGGWTP